MVWRGVAEKRGTVNPQPARCHRPVLDFLDANQAKYELTYEAAADPTRQVGMIVLDTGCDTVVIPQRVDEGYAEAE